VVSGKMVQFGKKNGRKTERKTGRAHRYENRKKKALRKKKNPEKPDLGGGWKVLQKEKEKARNVGNRPFLTKPFLG